MRCVRMADAFRRENLAVLQPELRCCLRESDAVRIERAFSRPRRWARFSGLRVREHGVEGDGGGAGLADRHADMTGAGRVPALEELKPVGMDGSGDMPDPPCGGLPVGEGPPQLIGGDCRSGRFLLRRGRRAHRPFRRFQPPAAQCRRRGSPVWRSGCGSRGRKGAFSFAYPRRR